MSLQDGNNMKVSVGSDYTMTKLPFQETESHKTKKYSEPDQSKPYIERIIVVLEVGCLGEIGGGYQTLSKNDLW